MTIHENTELPNIEKLMYLLTYLIGDAKRAIEGILLSDANYDLAVNTFAQRFGPRDLLINEHIDQLKASRPIRSSMNIERLREMYDKVPFRFSALEALGVPREQYAVVLNRVILRCLPDDLTLIYRQRVKETDKGLTDESAMQREGACRVKELLDFLRIQIQIREEGRQE